jgi:hypothetical protein
MHASAWASSVAVVSAIGASVGWLLARKEKREAAQYACNTLEAARDAADAEARTAEALERSADVDEAQHRRATELFEAEEESPWDLLPIPGAGYCELVNRTGRPRYHVHIGGPGLPLRDSHREVLVVHDERQVRWRSFAQKQRAVEDRLRPVGGFFRYRRGVVEDLRERSEHTRR